MHTHWQRRLRRNREDVVRSKLVVKKREVTPLQKVVQDLARLLA
jgi:hypothetical protein